MWINKVFRFFFPKDPMGSFVGGISKGQEIKEDRKRKKYIEELRKQNDKKRGIK